MILFVEEYCQYDEYHFQLQSSDTEPAKMPDKYQPVIQFRGIKV